jgi:hypothetical protein
MAFENEEIKRFKTDASNRRQSEVAKENLAEFKKTWKLEEKSNFSFIPWIIVVVIFVLFFKIFQHKDDKNVSQHPIQNNVPVESTNEPLAEVEPLEAIQVVKPITSILSTTYDTTTSTCPLTLIADNKNYYVKLCDTLNGNKTVGKFFVNAGETLKTKIPAGRYMIKYGGGDDWYGEEELFGAFSQYGQSETLDFTFDGMLSTGHTIVFQKMVNGNFHTNDVNRDYVLQN